MGRIDIDSLPDGLKELGRSVNKSNALGKVYKLPKGWKIVIAEQLSKNLSDKIVMKKWERKKMNETRSAQEIHDSLAEKLVKSRTNICTDKEINQILRSESPGLGKSTHPQDPTDYRVKETNRVVKCLCGAKHTSNPNWHMNCCPLSDK